MKDFDRRSIIVGAAATGLVAAAGIARTAEPASIASMPAWRIRDLIKSGQIGALEVTEIFLNRIATLDPKLHAFREVDAEGARRQARDADRLRGAGRNASLFGVPIAIKEGVAVKGLYDPHHGAIAPSDSIVVERLRSAGAVIVGSTVMPGMGNWPEQKVAYGTEPPGDLARHPRNPWMLDRVPGSSSAGSAAAVAGGLVPVAIGGDGGGSTRLPSALSGVIGVHPTRGRIPAVDYGAGSFELTNTVGPVAHDARDAALIMQAVAGPDGRDFIAAQDDIDYLTELTKGVRGLKFAWTSDYGLGETYGKWQSPVVMEAVRKAAVGFTKLGATVAATDKRWEDFWPPYLATSQLYRSGTTARRTSEAIGSTAAHDALAARGRAMQTFRDLMVDHDLLLSPTVGFTAPTVEEWDAAWRLNGAKYPHGTFAPVYTTNTMIYNWIGWPAISVPCGVIDGLPIGLQISTKPAREGLLLRAAHAFVETMPIARPAMALG